MLRAEFARQVFYYFVRLPLFSLKTRTMSCSSLEDLLAVCPRGPKAKSYHDAVAAACNAHQFLRGHDAERLTSLYNLVSTVREADTFLYPFLTKKTVTLFNSFYGLETLSECYEKGPVLVLYAHTGSFYEVAAATGEAGFRVDPIAYGIDPSTMEEPFRCLFALNMKLSERHFSGGRYLYANTPDFARTLRRILSVPEKTVILAAIDLPQSFTTEKRRTVKFLDGQAAFPYRIIDLFSERRLPIMTAFPYIDIDGQRVKRIVRYERVPDGLDSTGVLRDYASRLEDFITERPEQLLTLVSLGGFFE